MYTVGRDMLPEADRTAEAVKLMVETLADVNDLPFCDSVMFTGEVLQDTTDPDRFSVAGYTGKVIAVSTVEPPTFRILVNEGWQQIAECDCPESDIDIFFDDFGQAMAEAELSDELDEFAGAPSQEPHFESLPNEVDKEVTIRFDRLGWYGCSGVVSSVRTN